MATIIKYNGIDPFSDLAVGTPLVTRNYNPVYNNERHAVIDSFVLTGRIKRDDCNGGFSSMKDQIDELINRFSYNFKSFQIETNSQVVYNADYAIVRSIRIDESNFYNLVPFTIQIDIISDNYVSGVLEPEEKWEYEDNGDCTVSIIHTISARGVNSSIQALDSAKNFVSARAGYSGSNYSQTFTFSYDPILVSKKETVDRLSGRVSLVETYLYGGARPDTYCVTTYTMDVSQRDGQTEIAISGNIQGGESNTMSVVQNAFDSIDWYTLAANVFLNYNPVDSLPEQPVSYSTTINSEEKTLSFQFRYSDSADTDVYLVDSTTITQDLIAGVTCIEYKGNVRANGSCGANRWTTVNNYFNNLNIDLLVAQKWAQHGNGGRLASKPKSKTITHDEFNGQISFSVSYCDSNKEDCGCLQDFDYQLNFRPALPLYSSQPTLDGEGCHYIEDLNGLTRAQFQINGRAKSSFCCTLERSISELKTRLNLLCNKYFGGTDKILESSNITEDQNSRLIDFSCGWSADNNIIIPSYLIEGIGVEYDIDALNYIRTIESIDGVYLNNIKRAAINSLFISLKQNTLWDLIQELYLFVGPETLASSLVKAKGTGLLDEVNFTESDYNKSTGLIGDGSSKYIKTGFLASSLNNYSHHIYFNGTGFQSSGDKILVGMYNTVYLLALDAYANYISGRAFRSGSPTASFIPTLSSSLITSGSVAGSRTSSTSVKLYQNGSPVATNTNNITINFPSLELYLFTLNNLNSPTSAYITTRCRVVSVGLGLSDSQMSTLDSIINTFISAVA